MAAPVSIEHPSGARATVHPYGATIMSFKTCSGREVLFVSSLAKLDGSKPIRGGIPLVFPQFGQPDKTMPQHGILRNRMWKVGRSYSSDEDESSCCEFHISFPPGDPQNKFYCNVTLLVKLQANSLTTILTVFNPEDARFEIEFQALFHTYYRVEGGKALQKEACNVRGLSGYHVVDKITNETYVLQEGAIVHIDREVDRIYTPSAGAARTLKVMMQTGTGAKDTIIEASATVDGKIVPVSVVVWNPFIEKSKDMVDFDNEEYHDMICVEPGMLTSVPALKSGGKAEFKQVITSF